MLIIENVKCKIDNYKFSILNYESMKQTQIGTMTKLEPSEGGLIHKIGTDVYAPNSIMLLPGESVDMYEEVAARPAFTDADYKTKVSELIHQRYDLDDEIALLNNVRVEDPKPEHLAEYADYQAYREECKQRAKEPALYAATNYEVGTTNEGECDG